MNATSISIGLLIVLFTIILLRWTRKLKTSSRGVSISKDVPILRIDHVSTKGMLPGVWPALYDGGVLDFKEMNHCMVQISHDLRGFSG